MYLQSHFLNLSWVQSCRNPARFLPPSASQRLLGNWNFSCIQYPDYLMNHLLNSSKSTGHSRRVTNCNNKRNQWRHSNKCYNSLNPLLADILVLYMPSKIHAYLSVYSQTSHQLCWVVRCAIELHSIKQGEGFSLSSDEATSTTIQRVKCLQLHSWHPSLTLCVSECSHRVWPSFSRCAFPPGQPWKWKTRQKWLYKLQASGWKEEAKNEREQEKSRCRDERLWLSDRAWWDTHKKEKKQNGIVCLSNQTRSSNDERQHVGIVALSNKWDSS